MNHAEFEAVVQEAMDSLPDWVHEALEHIEIVVADEPGDECEPGEEDLLGLYVGTPLTERSLDDEPSSAADDTFAEKIGEIVTDRLAVDRCLNHRCFGIGRSGGGFAHDLFQVVEGFHFICHLT